MRWMMEILRRYRRNLLIAWASVNRDICVALSVEGRLSKTINANTGSEAWIIQMGEIVARGVSLSESLLANMDQQRGFTNEHDHWS